MRKTPKDAATQKHERPSNFNVKDSRVAVPNLSEKMNQIIADKPQLPRVSIEEKSASKEKITASKKAVTQKCEHPTRSKAEEAVENPHNGTREHKNPTRSKIIISKDNLSSAVLSIDSGKLE